MMFGIKAHTMNPAAEILWGISLSALFFISGCEVQAAITSIPTPRSFEAVGCFRDNHGNQRPLPELIVNLRDRIAWDDFNTTIYKCASTAMRHNYLYFGVQFWGECWSGPNAEKTYFVDGKSSNCFVGVGKDFANFIYRFVVPGTPSMLTSTLAPTTGPTTSYCSDGFLPGCECERYDELSSRARSQFTIGGVAECDDQLSIKWYRFTGAAGDRMPSECVSRRHCGTHAPGWLRGIHPSEGEGIVGRTVCFSWRGSCCRWQRDVSVRNCGGYYVYKLGPPPACRLKYCGNGYGKE